MKKGAIANKEKSMPGSIAVGTAVSIMVTFIAAAILAMLIENSNLSPETMGYGVFVLLMVSSVVGAIFASIQFGLKKMIVSILTAICYFISLLCITALFFDGIYKGVPVTALVVIAGGIIAGFVPTKQGKSVKNRKRKKRYG